MTTWQSPGTNCLLALTTIDSHDKAKLFARTVIDENLVTCVNIVPGIESIYRWEGKVCDAREWLLIMKTTDDQVPQLKKRLPELHHYDCPELIILPITDGHPAYLEWLADHEAFIATI